MVQALATVSMEAVLFSLTALAAFAVAKTSQDGDIAARVWVVALVVQSLPHGLAVVTASISGLSDHKAPTPFDQESRLSQQI